MIGSIFWTNIQLLLITVVYGQSTSSMSTDTVRPSAVFTSTKSTANRVSSTEAFVTYKQRLSPSKTTETSINKDASSLSSVGLQPSQSDSFIKHLSSKTRSLIKPSQSTLDQLVSVNSTMTSVLQKMSSQLVISPSVTPSSTPIVISPSSMTLSSFRVLYSTEFPTKQSVSQVLRSSSPVMPALSETSLVAQTSIVHKSVNTTSFSAAMVNTTAKSVVIKISGVSVEPVTSVSIVNNKGKPIDSVTTSATSDSVLMLNSTLNSVLMKTVTTLGERVTSVSVLNSTGKSVTIGGISGTSAMVNSTVTSVLTSAIRGESVTLVSVVNNSESSIIRGSISGTSAAMVNTTPIPVVTKTATVIVGPVTSVSAVNRSESSIMRENSTEGSISATSAVVNNTLNPSEMKTATIFVQPVTSASVLNYSRKSIARGIISVVSIITTNTTLDSAVMKTVSAPEVTVNSVSVMNTTMTPFPAVSTAITARNVLNSTSTTVNTVNITVRPGTFTNTSIGSTQKLNFSAKPVTMKASFSKISLSFTSSFRTPSITAPMSMISSLTSHFLILSATSVSGAISLSSASFISPLPEIVVQYRIEIEADCEKVLDIQSDAFKEAVVRSISDSLSIDISRVKILEVMCGSINVDFEIKGTDKDNITERLASAIAKREIIVNYNGARLTVISVTPNPTVTPRTSDDDDTVYIIYIVLGTVLGVAFLIGVVALIIKCRHERTAGMFQVPNEGQLELSGFSGNSKGYFRQGNFYGGLETEYNEPGLGNGNSEPNTAFYGDTLLQETTENGETCFGAADVDLLPEWKNLPAVDLSEAGRAEGELSTSNLLQTYGNKNPERERDLAKEKDFVNSYDNPSMMDTEDGSEN